MEQNKSDVLFEYVRRRRRGYVVTEQVLREHPQLPIASVREQIERLLASDLIVPTKSAKVLHPGCPPLMSKYRIVVRAAEPYDASRLCSRIAESSWIRNHPDEAREVDDFLQQLSGALDGELDTTGLDKREAGYLLALDEHAFDGSTAYAKALSALGVELSEMGVVDVPYPPTMEVFSQGDGSIVVSENVGPYNRLRQIARNGSDALAAFGFAPSAVVLGNGRFATHPRFIADVLEQARLLHGCALLYWGDLDREGLFILTELASNDLVRTRAWAQPYHAMLEAARHRAPRASRDKRGILPDLRVLEDALSASDLALAQRLIRQGAIVPQEAVRPEAYRDGSFA